jgi:hypothetical protein
MVRLAILGFALSAGLMAAADFDQAPLCSPILLSALMGRKFTPFLCAN